MTRTVSLRVGTEERNRRRRFSAVKVSRGWALHRSIYRRTASAPRDGWSVSHIESGRALMYDLCRADAETLFSAAVQRHPNMTGDLRGTLAPSTHFKRWCHRTAWWRYAGYKPERIPRGKLMVKKTEPR